MLWTSNLADTTSPLRVTILLMQSLIQGLLYCHLQEDLDAGKKTMTILVLPFPVPTCLHFLIVPEEDGLFFIPLLTLFTSHVFFFSIFFHSRTFY